MFAIWDDLNDAQLAGTHDTVNDANNALMELVQLHADQHAEHDEAPAYQLSVREA